MTRKEEDQRLSVEKRGDIASMMIQHIVDARDISEARKVQHISLIAQTLLKYLKTDGRSREVDHIHMTAENSLKELGLYYSYLSESTGLNLHDLSFGGME